MNNKVVIQRPIKIIPATLKSTNTLRRKIYLKYKAEGFSEKNATLNADNKIRDNGMSVIMNKYTNTIYHHLELHHGNVHIKLLESIESYLEDDICREKLYGCLCENTNTNWKNI